MSLINDMLKDLAARQQAQSPAAAPPLYTPVPPPAPQWPAPVPAAHWLSLGTVLQTVMTVVLAAGVAWWVAQLPDRRTTVPGLSAGLTATAALESVQPMLSSEGRTVPPAAPSQRVLNETSGGSGSTTEPAAARTEPQAIVRAPEPTISPTHTPSTSANSKQGVTAPTQPPKRVLEPSAAAKPVPRAVGSTPLPSVDNARANASPQASAASPPAPAEDPAVKAERLYQQALSEQRQGQAEPALATLQSALVASPRHVNARLTLARMLVERKQAAGAAEILADGLMLLPQQTDFMLALAPLWIQAGQQNDAMALLAQGVRSANNHPAFHAYYASQLLRLKRQPEAIAHYRLALSGDATQPDWLLGLGLALQATGQSAEAVNAFSRALATGKLNPQSKAMVEQLIVRLQSTPS